MPKTLIITEKPSVARTIASALGVRGKRDGFLEDDRFIISWCLGHLVELKEAAAYDARYEKWRLEDLPIVPDSFRYQIKSKTRGQYTLLKRLMARPDVEMVVNACDAGREGELIFRLVYNMAGCQLPMKRLWLSSLEKSAILKGMKNLHDGKEFDDLFASAQCRQKADWLVGINGTRLFSCLHGHLLNVGRVVTPTLKLLTERSKEIADFHPEKYYHVRLDLGGGEAKSEKLATKEQAEDLARKCHEGSAVCTSVIKETKQTKPPKLFDLTSLQREANRLFGCTAQQTLNTAQDLYEKKLITYPRTDSAYLSDDMGATALAAAQSAQEAYGCLAASETLDTKSVLNSKKVSDHHAIIPTANLKKAAGLDLDERARNLLGLIAARLVTALLPPCRYEDTKAEFACADAQFHAHGKRILDEGFKRIESAYVASLKKTAKKKDQAEEEEEQTLPPYKKGDTFPHPKAKVTEHQTSAPKAYSEASLLGAMERAGAKETTDEAERKGLGTPATRAGIIEKLVKQKFAQRKGKTLTATDAGVALISLVPDNLASPQLTSEWENRLTLIREGKETADAFMEDIYAMTRDLVAQNKGAQSQHDRFQTARESLGTCPRCGGAVYAGKSNFYCSNRSCGFVMWKNDRFFQEKKLKFSATVAKSLLKKGRYHSKKVYSIKKDRYYEADIVLNDTGGKYVNYRVELTMPSVKK